MAFHSIYIALFVSLLTARHASAAPCSHGATATSYGTDWGDMPSSTSFQSLTCLTITNDRPYSREEVAYSGVPIAQSIQLHDPDLDRLVLMGGGGRRIPAQFNILSRWAAHLGDTSEPIKWLEVATPLSISANGQDTLELRLYDTSKVHAVDSTQDIILSTTSSTSSGTTHTITTGVASFSLNTNLAALLTQIEIDGSTVSSYNLGTSGPSITYIPQRTGTYGTSPRTLSSHTHATVDYVEVSESGPVKVTILTEGTWSDPSGASLCNTFSSSDPAPYESFTYSLALTFFRGRSDIKIQYHVRNQCSNANGSDWTDQTFLIDKAKYTLDFQDGIGSGMFHYHASHSNDSTSAGSSASSSTTTLLEQRQGGGSPWRRRSRVRNNGSTVVSREMFEAPIIAVANSNFMAATTLGYMRYREPQALSVTGSVLNIEVVSERQRVGEGKGLWNHAMILIRQTSLLDRSALLQSIRWPAILEIERGLLLHAPPQYYQETNAMPPLGHDNSGSTTIKTAYLNMMEELHTATVSSTGQWERAKTYGSQIWPDVQFDGYSVDYPNNPSQNAPKYGYWNPHAAELNEFFRSGNPKWAHDFALPLSWLMTYTAYLNIGRETHDWSRNGLCVNSGSDGDGNWHRSGFGSDDYMYNLAMKYVYPLRPDPIHRRRIEMTGRTVRLRYDRSVAEGDRDIYLERLDVARGVIQHMEAGMSCAEFAKTGGNYCHNWFLDVMSEFISDNLSTGSICQPDIVNGRNCDQPQTFMQFSMIYEFFIRVYLNYGDRDAGLRKAIVGIPSNFYQFGLQKRANGNIIYGGNHAALLECTTNSGRTALSSCTAADVGGGDGRFLYDHNINSVISALVIGDYFDPTLGFCDLALDAWNSESSIRDAWDTVNYNDGGWTKPTSQMMSLMAYGVGAFDLCQASPSPPSPTPPSPTPPTREPTQEPVPVPTTTSPPTPTPPTRVPTKAPTQAPVPNAPSPPTSILLHSTLNSIKHIKSPLIGVIGGETSLEKDEFVQGIKYKGALFGDTDGSGKYVRFKAGVKEGRKLKRQISLKAGSISFYYKPSYASAADDIDHALIVLGNYYATPKLVLMEGDALKFRIQKTYTQVWETTASWRADLWKANEWVFIQITWNKKKKTDSMKIYIDGKRVDNDNVKGGWKLKKEHKYGNLYVGVANANGDFPANGVIDDLVISSKSTKISSFDTSRNIDMEKSAKKSTIFINE